jgi:hypothetical protein
MLLYPVDQLASIAAIGPDQFQATPPRILRMLDALKQGLQHQADALAVLNLSRGHEDQQHPAQNIDHQMSFAPRHFLARIIAEFGSAFDRVGIPLERLLPTE